MIKKILVGTFFSLLLFGFSATAKADINHLEEFDKECKLMNCTIPVPTLIKPNDDSYESNQNFYLTGLTWNNTLIEIYIDGIHRGSATINENKKGEIANFYYQIDKNKLILGEHQWSAIVWSENKRDRGFISQKNDFSIELYAPLKKVIIPTEKTIIEKVENKNIEEQTSEELEISSTSTRESNLYVDPKQKINGIKIIKNQKNPIEITISKSDNENNLVVDKNRAELNKNQTNQAQLNENQANLNKIQPVAKNNEIENIISNNLDFSEKQARNKKIGIFLLIVLVIVFIFSTIVSNRKKNN